MLVGKIVWIRRLDISEAGEPTERTIGKGIVTARTETFVKVFGKDGDYVFDEWFPIESNRLWIVKSG